MFANDSVLVKEIVQYVVSRLDDIHKYKPHSKRALIGLDNQISHVKSLLLEDSKDVRAIGIWGMAGIGKTTIAEEVFDRLCSEYKSCYFMADIREEWRRHGRMYLKKKLYSALLRKEDLNIERPHGLPYVVERRLRGMKVLVVLDDVSDKEQLEILIGTLEWFGKGSRIIITTSDKQVLSKRVDDNDVYQLKPLDFDDSFQLFISTAFGQNHPKMEYENDKLLEKMVNYAQGIPLVLKELGYFIGGKDREAWKRECEKLTREPLKNGHDAIRLSCNYLNGVNEIVECREKDGQILEPHGFAQPHMLSLPREQGWKFLRMERFNISGYASSIFANEYVHVHKHKSHSERLLIGLQMAIQISHVESLLMSDSKDVRAIGIWGMAGMGKTTIVEEVYRRLCSEYDSCYFKANVRKEWERHGRMHLKKELYSALLRKENLNIERPHGLPYFIERRLRHLKVLVVLDDVSDEEQLEILIETLDWFGRGSRIIITSRHKQVFLNKVDDNDVYQAIGFL
ncbi:disease resistance protein RUN1-like [Trifolium pratense]|uniref:disease resistance protein RUN1-like n=1 Tax=Trifolium pratense TaxID=57577 RepID=UPI001E692D88|nr:disease resistance protein RUN1-like [Trifolium pratense]